MKEVNVSLERTPSFDLKGTEDPNTSIYISSFN